MYTDLPLTPDLFATPDRFLWHPATRTAILADLHLNGSFSHANSSLTFAAWTRLAARNPARVILAGDLFDLSELNEPTITACRELFALLPKDCRITLTPGNHDPANLAPALNIETDAFVRLAGHIISHGHDLPSALAEATAATWIVGHQHPAVTFRTRVQSAKMPCFAVCDFPARRHPRRLILLPAFTHDPGSPLGSNLLTANHWLLPLPRPPLSQIRIFGIVEPAPGPPQILDFGPLSGLR